MSTITPLRREAGDPAKGWWTYADLAAVFGVSIDTLRRRMVHWDGQGFPVPLPWHQTEKRWHPAAVLAWKARYETRIQARAPELVVHQGGRA